MPPLLLASGVGFGVRKAWTGDAVAPVTVRTGPTIGDVVTAIGLVVAVGSGCGGMEDGVAVGASARVGSAEGRGPGMGWSSLHANARNTEASQRTNAPTL